MPCTVKRSKQLDTTDTRHGKLFKKRHTPTCHYHLDNSVHSGQKIHFEQSTHLTPYIHTNDINLFDRTTFIYVYIFVCCVITYHLLSVLRKCKHFSPSPNRHRTYDKYLNILYFNSRSLKNKVNLLHAFMSQQTPMEYDLVFVSETWLKPEFSDSLICPGGYSVIRQDRKDKTRGGGVLVFYKTTLKVVDITPSYDHNVFESLVIELPSDCHNTNKLRFCCTYLPPSKSRALPNVKSCCNFLKQLVHNGPLFILGDFNFPTIDWSSMCSNNSSEQHFADFCGQYGLYQHISEPTYHGHHQSDSILDLVLSNPQGSSTLVSTSLVQPICTTCDHDAIVLKVNHRSSQPFRSSKPTFCFRKANYDLILPHLRSIDWNIVLSIASQDIQLAYNNFIGIIHSLFEKHVPKITFRKGFSLPKELKKLAKSKSSLYKRKKKDPSLNSDYKIASKTYEKEVKKWFSSIEENICSSRDRSNFYKYANRKLKMKETIPSVLILDGRAVSDNLEKANFFNDQFTSVFQRDNLTSLNLVDKTSIHLENIYISDEDIISALSSVKSKASKTPDQIPPIFLKNAGSTLIPALKQLFQASLDSGTLPLEWKTALVNPVHKKGSKNDALNYRPISLTSAICRLLEIIIKTKILNHLYQNNLVSDKQHGFLPGRSITTQLLISLNTVLKKFDAKKDVHVLYTDFSKAFDKVCHRKLLEVLSSFGIKGSLLKWIQSFLTGRTQAVYVGDEVSQTTVVTSGVPQGSVLGPLLFLLFVQDIEYVCSPFCDVALFADDCKFISSNPYALQRSLDHLKNFVAARQLVISQSKCTHLTVTRREPDCHFSIDSTVIPTALSVKDLGVTITSKLLWKPHIVTITKKAFHAAHKILFSFTTNNFATLLFAFKTFVRPILESNSVVWSPHLIENINRLESVQVFFTKKLFQRCGLRSSGYTDRLSKSNLKSLEHRRLLADLVMVYKILNGLVDIDPNLLFTFKPVTYHLRGHNQTLDRPKAASNTALNFFPSRTIRSWNALSQEIVDSTSIALFKSRVNNLDLVALKKSCSI